MHICFSFDLIISCLIDFDDWQITHDLFVSLEELWGPHTVDCFANYYTAKLPRFFSRFWNPGASGIDFFAQELSSENCLVVPPVSVVARVIHYWFSLFYRPRFSRLGSNFCRDYPALLSLE